MTEHMTGGIPVRDMTVIALVAVMVLIGKTLLRVPISLSGHAGVLWIAALIIGRAIVRRPGAATLMALLGGVLVAMAQPSDGGPFFTVAKYAAAGVLLDLLASLLGDRFDRPIVAMIAGSAAHAGKVAVDLLQGVAAGLTGPVLLAGATVDLTLHIAFGALGGLLAALVLRALIRAHIPQLTTLPGGGEAR